MVDKVIVEPDVKEEDPKHVEEMIAKAEGKTIEEPLLAGKYKDQEALEKGVLEVIKASGRNLEDFYKELESNLGKPNKAASVEEEAEGEPEDKAPNDEETNETDFTKFEEEYATAGTLSENSYKELEKMGYPKYLVDGYLDGQKARAEAAAQAVYNITGSEENYQRMIAWADKSLSEQDKIIFNQQVNTGINEASFAVKALYADYVAANGNPPKSLIKGGTPTGNTFDVYESIAQMTEDMKNPKYKTDEAFRAKVKQKLARSKIL